MRNGSKAKNTKGYTEFVAYLMTKDNIITYFSKNASSNTHEIFYFRTHTLNGQLQIENDLTFSNTIFLI